MNNKNKEYEYEIFTRLQVGVMIHLSDAKFNGESVSGNCL